MGVTLGKMGICPKIVKLCFRGKMPIFSRERSISFFRDDEKLSIQRENVPWLDDESGVTPGSLFPAPKKKSSERYDCGL